MVKRTLLLVIIGALTLGGIGSWWLLGPVAGRAVPADAPSAVSDDSPGAPPDRTLAPPDEVPVAGETKATQPDDAAAAPIDDDARLRAAQDYFEFARETHDRARRGDASAQYYLSSALTYCESLYDWYFIVHLPNGVVRHRTLDEALQLTASRPVFTADDVNDLQQRCQRLRKLEPPPFGTSREWLDAAIGNGFPLAQASAALNLALQGYERGDADKAGAARAAARQMALEALRTRDPRVMAQMGDVAANLAADDPAEARKVQWVWPLAACLRETNCESMTDWTRLFCNVDTQCQPFETPVDIIRRQAGNDYDEVERRARELNQKIDAGTLDEADFP